jgi:Secretion system C-terminal sorting domain
MVNLLFNRKFLLITLLFCATYIIASAQNKDSLRGNLLLSADRHGACLNFGTIPTSYTTVDSNINVGDLVLCGSNICDTAGKYLMAASQLFALNKYLQKIPDSLGSYDLNLPNFTNYGGGLRDYHTSLILPKKNNLYYVFNTTVSDTECVASWQNPGPYNYYRCDGFAYSIIDASARNDSGLIISKLNMRTPPRARRLNYYSKAVRHGNGKDWWILKPCIEQNTIAQWLVTEDSVSMMKEYIFEAPYYDPNTNVTVAFYCDISMDGTQYVVGNSGEDTVVIYDFDRCSGNISINEFIALPPYLYFESAVFNNIRSCGGISLSPNKQFMYFVETITEKIYQFDRLTKTWDSFSFQNSFSHTYDIQIGQDSLIYSATGGNGGINLNPGLTRISNTDSLGIACTPHYFAQPNLSSLPFSSNIVPKISNIYNITNFRMPPVAGQCWPAATKPQQEVQPTIDVFPNPSGHVVNFTSNATATSNFQLQVYSTEGRLVTKSVLPNNNPRTTVDVSQWPAGIYYYCISDGIQIKARGKLRVY